MCAMTIGVLCIVKSVTDLATNINPDTFYDLYLIYFDQMEQDEKLYIYFET